jgi:uroporphyrin-III C-methyltransferase
LQQLPAHTPAAVVERASLADERSVVTTLGGLADAITRERLASPCIIVVGDVLQGVAAAQGLDRRHHRA